MLLSEVEGLLVSDPLPPNGEAGGGDRPQTDTEILRAKRGGVFTKEEPILVQVVQSVAC